MALLIKDISVLIYRSTDEGIFKAILMHKSCRVIKTHTFSVDSMPQGRKVTSKSTSIAVHIQNIKSKSFQVASQKLNLKTSTMN